MDDLSNILALIFNSGSQESVGSIVTEKNIRDLQLIKSLLSLKTNQHYEKGMDEHADFIVECHELSPDFLRGLKCGIAMSLAHDPMIIPSPHHQLLAEIYMQADSVLMEAIIDACDGN